MIKEKSCGIVVFDNNKVLLVHHNNGHWGMPKGHVEPGETEEETAIREVLEETSVDAKILPGFREVITYSPRENTMKDVVYFVGEPISINLKPQEEEVNEVRFVNVEEASNLITYEEDRSVFEEALKFKNNMSS